MAYFNITNTDATTLIEKTSTTYNQTQGNISSVYISNNDSSQVEIDLYFQKYSDNTIFYVCKDLVIPSKVSVNLTDRVSFDVKFYKLIIRANEGSSNPNITVIT